MSFNLAGKRYLVTGAGRGLGRLLAKTLSEQGCKVYALSRTQATLETLTEENPDIHIIQADIRKWDVLKEKLDSIGVLDGLVNNAANMDELSVPALDVSKDFLDKTFHTNVFAAINAIQIVAKKMIAAKKPGSIVNVSSVFSIQSFPNFLAYTSSKAALDMVTKQFALELGPHNIRVNSVNPTLINTEDIKKLIKEVYPFDQIYINKSAMGRIAELEDVIKPILYLLSDYSSLVSGTTNIVDGALLSSFITKL